MGNGEKKNDEATTKINYFNYIFFTWTIPLFVKGTRRNLVLSDLDKPTKSDESERATDALEREWRKELEKANQDVSKKIPPGKQKSSKYKPSLLKAIFRTFWLPYLFTGIFVFFQAVILRTMQPLFQEKVIAYFSQTSPDAGITQNEAYLQTLGLIGVTFGMVITNHHCFFSAQQLGMRIRVACCSLIYRKVLRLNLAVIGNTAAGHVVNLLSNDVSRFDLVFMWLHYLWIMPIQMAVQGYVMWQYVGISAVIGLTSMVLQTVPIQGIMSILCANLRARIAVKTDDRVQLMSELIAGIQVVKMYAWEKPFEMIVSKVRSLEMKLVARASHFRAFYISAMNFSERVNVYFTIMSFILMGNTISPGILFVLTTFFNTIQLTIAFGFPQALIMGGEMIVSIKRLQEFLLMEEAKISIDTKAAIGSELVDQNGKERGEKAQKIRLETKNIVSNWVPDQKPLTLSDVSILVESQSLCGVVGTVGSGKSSLLHVILGELPPQSGSLEFYSTEGERTRLDRKEVRISYSSQEPWLFSGSVRENILFGEPYDKRRYAEVTKACALLRDFEQLPHGDATPVGERGGSLSGGQRARVNLARAVYKDADLYLLDDPLSAVDARVGRQLFEECIKGYLRGKTRILVTHQLQFLQQTDSIVILDRGMVKCQGTFEELSHSELAALRKEEEEMSEEDEPETQERNGLRASSKHLSRNTSVTASYSSKSRRDSMRVVEALTSEEEEVETGALSNKVYGIYAIAGGNICALVCLIVSYLGGQTATSGIDFWLSYWTGQQTTRTQLEATGSNVTTNDSIWYDEYGLFKMDVAIYIYTGVVFGCVFLMVMRNIFYVKVTTSSSDRLHHMMFSNLLLAKMRFFHSNPSGRILNRFSKDIGSIDELLPKSILEGSQILLVMCGVVILIIIANYWMAIPTLVLGAIFYTFRFYYLKTAQDVKRLEGIAKSPVFSLVDSTFYGLTTIRTRGAPTTRLLRKTFDNHQNVHTSAWFGSLSTAATFGLLLDILSCIFTASICILFISTNDGSTMGTTVGLAISQSLILTGILQYGVRQSAEIVSQMTAVERVLQYTKLPQEGPFTSPKTPPSSWPPSGGLKFNKVYMKYNEQDQPVLKDLNITIKPGWKVGIVGRTGAGKSSLISALFRLVDDGLTGEIDIDGVDTKSIGLHELRPKISIIPQEPVLFSASLRYNLDPFEQYTDEELWSCLRVVELNDFVPSLDYSVAEGGANFSMGQRQLICLARAVLRNNQILVLDEATANIDPHTDALIQTTIRKRFAECTVLTIAHRLNTIMDSDRVLTMERGSMMEFDHPHVLLQNPNGYFSQMVQQTGKTMAEKLASIAEQAYRSSEQSRRSENEVIVNEDDVIARL